MGNSGIGRPCFPIQLRCIQNNRADLFWWFGFDKIILSLWTFDIWSPVVNLFEYFIGTSSRVRGGKVITVRWRFRVLSGKMYSYLFSIFSFFLLSSQKASFAFRLLLEKRYLNTCAVAYFKICNLSSFLLPRRAFHEIFK